MILGSIFFVAVCLPILLMVYFTDKAAAKPNGNFILGSTVPRSKMEDEELLEIVNKYKKEEKSFIKIGFITAIPVIFVGIKSSFIFSVYLLFWMIIMIIGESILLKKYFNKVQVLKRKNDWFPIKKRVLTIDTEVSKMKDKMVISKLYFIPTLIINIVGIIYMDNLIISFSIASTSLVCFLLYIYYLNRPTVVYSKNTEVNFRCNLVYRRQWSIIWTVTAFLSSLPNIVFLISEKIAFISIVAISLGIFITIYVCNSKIRDTQSKLLNSINDEIYVDDDEYWKGMFYNNPNDKNLMVETRVGIGTTINMARPAAKVITALTAAIIIGAIILVSVLGIKASDTNFKLIIDNNNIKIDASMYDMEFNVDEVQDIQLIDNLPKASRINGVGTEDIALGNYKVDGYGKSRMFVKRDVSKIVVIKLENQFIFITGNNEEQSQQYYDILENKFHNKAV